MVRTYNIGTECYALITSTSEPEFLLPVKVVILEKYTLNDSATYKVKIKEIYELSDKKVKIPMLGKTESLNASVAASIMIYEYVRRKIFK